MYQAGCGRITRNTFTTNSGLNSIQLACSREAQQQSIATRTIYICHKQPIMSEHPKEATVMSIKKSVLHGMEQKEVNEYVGNLGLGYGIDATNPKPWESKRPYKVCRFEEGGDKLLIVDEGGNWHSYQYELESQHELQCKLNSSIGAPNSPVCIGVGAEVSRKSNRSSIMYGVKLVDCQVYVCPDSYRLSCPGVPGDFETRLSSWIMDRIRYYISVGKLVQKDLETNLRAEQIIEHMAKQGLKDFRPELAEVIAEAAKHNLTKDDKSQEAKTSDVDQITKTNCTLLIVLCGEFIRFFNVTHFVSAIQVGASLYRVTEGTTKVDRKNVAGKLALFQSVQFSANASYAWKKLAKSEDTRKLGVITADGKVERLAVLGVSVLPITERVRTPYLRFALERALNEYIDETEYYEDVDQPLQGPFKISIKVAGSPDHYLRVHWDDEVQKSSCVSPTDLAEPKDTDHAQQTLRHRSLQPTDKETEAALFFLIPVDTDEQNEFFIVYYHKNLPTKLRRYTAPLPGTSIPYYLQADSNLVGWKVKNGLWFVTNPNNHCRFRFMRTINLSKNSESSLLKYAQSESIYIRCPRHWKHTAYVHMCKSEGTTPEESTLTMGCIDKKDANKEKSLFFLFGLKFAKP